LQPRSLQFTPEEARSLLKGVTPVVQSGLLSIMEGMAEYMLETEDTDFTMHHLYAAMEDLDTHSPEECQFIQLCEESSRKIANSSPPTSYKQIERLDGTLEGSLVREAMLDEVV